MSATVELLQTLIRNRCVNDGTPESGHEHRNAEVLADFSGRPGSTSSGTTRHRGARRWWRASRAPTTPRRACA